MYDKICMRETADGNSHIYQKWTKRLIDEIEKKNLTIHNRNCSKLKFLFIQAGVE